MSKRGQLCGLTILLVFALILGGCGGNAASNNKAGEEKDFKPSKPIEVVAPAGAGGGWDTTARTVAKIMGEEQLIDKMAVVNKPGGGGATGWSYVHRKKGDNHTLFVTSPPLLFVPLNGQSQYGHEDFTPIASVIADYGAFVVHKDSPYQSMKDLIEALKKDPKSVSIVGTSSPGSMDHMQFVSAVQKAGVDAKQLKYITAQDGAGMSMLLGKKADVYSTGVGEAAEQARAGKVRVLAITAPERMKGETVKDFPTLKEQGIDDEFTVWRGFMGPPGMSEAAVKFYEKKIKEMMEKDSWKSIRDSYGWEDKYMDHKEFKTYLDAQHKAMKSLLDEIGLGDEAK
ncbi:MULTISPECIES: tripartite tricarboxylate transporter substrate binding protein [Bacillus]|uniref:tripartite tricarboxylate transporter substrate binding protein n=1 Tax=Bacillus TaxID=1386 RepID=UPI000417A317|nr:MULTISPECIES: tripartite tricarboxylate transporter substrate binding protein [Bacillus]QHZ46252.1 tripartite tricarboxylate transporter substrate binding protein [Bacillus sp. NSP9.1]